MRLKRHGTRRSTSVEKRSRKKSSSKQKKTKKIVTLELEAASKKKFKIDKKLEEKDMPDDDYFKLKKAFLDYNIKQITTSFVNFGNKYNVV